VGSGVAYDVAPMQHTPPPVFIKHDDNWGSTPPGFVTKERLQARSPVSEDRAVGGGWTPKRSAREQRRADSANFLARVTPSSRRHPGGTSGGAGSGGGGGGGGGVLGAVGGGLVEEGSVAGNVAQVGFSPSRRFRVQDGAGRKGRYVCVCVCVHVHVRARVCGGYRRGGMPVGGCRVLSFHLVGEVVGLDAAHNAGRGGVLVLVFGMPVLTTLVLSCCLSLHPSPPVSCPPCGLFV